MARLQTVGQKSEKITALYERLSRDDDQIGDSNSIVNQKKYLESYAEQKGYTNCRHYTDDGWSGGNFDRPAWKQLVSDIESGNVAHVIVKDMSRIGRDYLQTGFYTEVMFRQHGVHFVAIANSVDSDDQNSNEFAPFLNIMNEWYLRDLSRKQRTAIRVKGESGKPTTNSAIYGYKKDPNDKNKWLVDEEAADVVRRIFRLTIEGKGPYDIARILYDDKVETPAVYFGKRGIGVWKNKEEFTNPYNWSGFIVGQILSKPEYMGHTVNFRSHKASYKDKTAVKNPKEEWLIFENTHEANAISKNDIDTISNKFKEIEQSQRYIVASKQDNLESLISKFLQELLKSYDDIATQHYYEEFVKYGKSLKILKVKTDELLNWYMYMIYIERSYNIVVNLRKNAYSVSESVVARADNAIEYIDSINLQAVSEPLIKEYINYRRAEFEFRKGYYLDDSSAITAFGTASKTYLEMLKKYNIYFDTSKGPDKDTLNLTQSNYILSEVKIIAYLLNSVGECYSKICYCFNQFKTHDKSNSKISYQVDICSEWTIIFCKYAVEYSENIYEREVYYRNLACAYERRDRLHNFGDHMKLIIENYQKSIRMCLVNYKQSYSNRELSYYATLSYFNKCFDAFFYNNKTLETKINIEELKKIIKDFYYLSWMAVNDFQNKLSFQALNGLACAWSLVLDSSNEEKYQYYIKVIDERIHLLDIARKNDSYYSLLKLLSTKLKVSNDR